MSDKDISMVMAGGIWRDHTHHLGLTAARELREINEMLADQISDMNDKEFQFRRIINETNAIVLDRVNDFENRISAIERWIECANKTIDMLLRSFSDYDGK